MVLAFAGKAQNCSELFISEYAEGSGNNKAMEFYNPTPNAINMSNYRLVRYSNGSAIGTDSTDLTGTIPAFGTFVIANGVGVTSGATGTSPACNPALQALAQQIDGAYPSPTFMNGDDALVLARKSPYKRIDIFGKIGEQPTTAWSDMPPYDGTSGKWWTKDHSMQRKATIKAGILTNPSQFNPKLEYDSLPKDNWTKIGSHTCNCFVVLSTTVSATSSSVCSTYTTSLMATTNGGNAPVSFTWAPSSEIQGATNTATVVALPSSAATIIYTVTASDGFSTTTNTIALQSIACAPVTISLTPASSSVCITQTTSVSSSVAGGSGSYTYSWLPVSEIAGSTTGSSIIAKPTSTSSPVIYTVSVNDGGSTTTQTISIQANDCSLAFTPIISSTSSTVCTNQTLPITAEFTYGGSGVYTYSWSPASEITGATNTASISAHPTTTATVVYSVTVSDGVAAPVVLTMSINGIVCDVLVKENSKEIYLKMFPNPNNGNEIAFVSDKNIKEITIINTIGQAVLTHIEKSNESTVILNNLNLSKGIYYVIIKNEAGSKSEKLIIQ